MLYFILEFKDTYIMCACGRAKTRSYQQFSHTHVSFQFPFEISVNRGTQIETVE